METQLTSVKEDLSKVTSERDSMRNSLLEAEIANHENNNDRSRESENLKLELVKSQSAIETLEVTLSVRDNELKSKKEEIRKEKVRTMYLHMRKILMIDAHIVEITKIHSHKFLPKKYAKARNISSERVISQIFTM